MATYMIPCLLGLEKLVGDEVKRLGLKNIRVENGRIFCGGAPDDCARLNINLRCGARVLLVLGQTGPAAQKLQLFSKSHIFPPSVWFYGSKKAGVCLSTWGFLQDFFCAT